MRVVLFGASGRVGQLVVRVLLDEGYEVIAVVHSTNPLPVQPHLTVREVDIHDASAVAAVVSEGDVIVSTLGSWGTKSKDILTSAMRHIIPAMQAQGMRRIVSLTGAAAFFADEQATVLQRLMRQIIMFGSRQVVLDGEQHMQLLKDSDLDWTVIRSPVMNTNDGKHYELCEKLAGFTATIHREAVAKAMVAQLSDATWLRQAPTIWRSDD